MAEKFLQRAFNGQLEMVQVMETRKRVLGAEHPDTLTSINNLAHTFKKQHRDSEAIRLMFSCMELCLEVLGPAHPRTEAV